MEVSGQIHDAISLASGKEVPGTHCAGGSVGPIAGVDDVKKSQISCPCRKSNADSSAVLSFPNDNFPKWRAAYCRTHKMVEWGWSLRVLSHANKYVYTRRILVHNQDNMTLTTQHLHDSIFQNLLWHDISSETKFISLIIKKLLALTVGRWRELLCSENVKNQINWDQKSQCFKTDLVGIMKSSSPSHCCRL
jgi:hypothetical protein